MLKLFGSAIFVSAALLFMVQPLSGRVLLPLLGGSPAVWNSCMVFYQAVLLLGYLYAHVSTRYLPRKAQAAVHLVLLAVAGATLPMPVDVGEPGDANPIAWVVRTLALNVGPVFFVVSTSGPLLQRWFSTTKHEAAQDPYFLYSASNLGSMLGLLAYPLILEPLWTRKEQSVAWAIGFVALGVLVVGCVWAMLTRGGAAERAEGVATPASQEPVTWRRRGLWLALALAPSSLMLGVTQHITTDIAAIPLLWVGPLALYLLSFILAYSRRVKVTSRAWGRLLPVAVLGLMIAMLTGLKEPITLMAGAHMAGFFIAAMMCHTRLAELRPTTTHLTEYYLIMSLGGVLGGLINSVAGPMLFNALIEYPLMLGVVALLRPQIVEEVIPARPFWERWLVGAGCGLGLLLLLLQIDSMAQTGKIKGDSLIIWTRAGLPIGLCGLMLLGKGGVRFALGAAAILIGSPFIGQGGSLLWRERTFFGEHKVVATTGGLWHQLQHGTTIHGLQARDELGKAPPNIDDDTRFRMLFANPQEMEKTGARMEFRQLIPASYFHPTGPWGQVFKLLWEGDRLRKVAIIGLGAGSLAAYAKEGSRFTFFEIDPAVIRIAGTREFFSYIADATRKRADGTDRDVQVGYVLGDGRLGVKNSDLGPFDFIALDAFTSDAIPVHMVTAEAVRTYLDKLKPHGLLLFHISNRYFNLTKPLQRIGTELGLRVFKCSEDGMADYLRNYEGKKLADAVVMCRDEADFMPLAGQPQWERLPEERAFPLWTDDYSNLLRVMMDW